MHVVDIKLAQKYARAFIHSFFDDLSDQEIENLEKFRISLSEQKRILYGFDLFLNSEKLTQLFKTLLDNFNLLAPWQKLFMLLSAKKRLILLPIILQFIIDEYYQKKNRVVFFVESAHELEHHDIAHIKQFLRHCMKKEIILKQRVNKNLIAGIKLFNNNLGWEYSIQKQLLLLKNVQ